MLIPRFAIEAYRGLCSYGRRLHALNPPVIRFATGKSKPPTTRIYPYTANDAKRPSVSKSKCSADNTYVDLRRRGPKPLGCIYSCKSIDIFTTSANIAKASGVQLHDACVLVKEALIGFAAQLPYTYLLPLLGPIAGPCG